MRRCDIPGRTYCGQSEPCKNACLLYQNEFVARVVTDATQLMPGNERGRMNSADVRNVLELLADEKITVHKAQEWIAIFVFDGVRDQITS